MDKKQKLEELRARMQKDEGLPLKKGATNLVFGVGNPETEILFIGEGPGFWEDKKAEPFVGNAGALLNQLLRSINLPREEVYITNVVHHRPPENRDPELSEIAAYQPYLDGIIEIISPKVIVTLGRFSMGKFLPGAKISSVHGRAHRLNWKGRDVVVVAMYHPAAALN
jgi:uracil-DNA glycosylase family 4